MVKTGTFSEVLITFRGERLCGDRVFRYLCIVAIRLGSGAGRFVPERFADI